MKWKYKININGVNPEKIHRTQMYIDSEIIKRSEPYVPLKTGSLKRSGITGTRVGTGVIKYTAPYAKRQYFGFYEVFADWIENQSNSGNLPILDKYRIPQYIEVQSGGYVFDTDDSTARYQIQLNFVYYQDRRYNNG